MAQCRNTPSVSKFDIAMSQNLKGLENKTVSCDPRGFFPYRREFYRQGNPPPPGIAPMLFYRELSERIGVYWGQPTRVQPPGTLSKALG